MTGTFFQRSRRNVSLAGMCILVLASMTSVFAGDSVPNTALVRPFLEKNCFACHAHGERKGNIALDEIDGDGAQATEIWHKVLKQLRAKSMPPFGEPSPSDDERSLVMAWIKSDVFRHNPQHPDPGVVTVRRLNRTEYRNTIRDLMGVDFDTNNNFPADDTGYGFDNIADVLTISPLLLEKYISASKEIVLKAVPVVSGVMPRKVINGGDFAKEVIPQDPAQTPPKEEPAATPGRNQRQGNRQPPRNDPRHLTLSYYEHAIGKLTANVATTGHYRVEFNVVAAENFVDNVFDYNKCQVVIRIDDKVMLDHEFARQGGDKLTFAYDAEWTQGEHSLSVELTPLNPAKEQVRSLRIIILNVALVGPAGDEYLVPPANYDRFFPRPVPANADERRTYAAELLRQFVSKAYRRPADDLTVDRLVAIAEGVAASGKKSFESGVAQAMTAVLASPRFLFREEQTIDEAGDEYQWLDDYSLASRLSYFLWSTMPDRELLELAARGELRSNLDVQVNRMLDDGRGRALFQNFVGQWLQSREVESIAINSNAVLGREREPDPEADRVAARFRELRSKPPESLTDDEKVELEKTRETFFGSFRRGQRFNLDDKIRRAMRAETEMLFEYILKQDRHLVELIECNYAFLNEALATFYEIPGLEPVKGDESKRVMLPDGSMRGGILAQGTFLAVTSNPNRTSPVKRGLFILENVLGSPVAAPPPNIPSLEDSDGKKDGRKQTLRETLEIHRTNAVCSSCHNKMDPLGLAFENFNALGRWRERELSQPVDATGRLASGEAFLNVAELKKILVENHRQEFYYCVSEKMLTYALGRGLDYRDEYALDEIVAMIEKSGGKGRALLEGVVHSSQFLKKRRER